MPDWLAPLPALRERIHPSTSTRQVRTMRKGMDLMTTAKTMAEVLAEHWFSPADYAYCLCGVDMSPDKPVGVHEALADHQAAALSAAGFGLVADALDLRQIADLIMLKVVYAGNEGWQLTSEDRDDHEYVHCLNAAQAIIEQARAVS